MLKGATLAAVVSFGTLVSGGPSILEPRAFFTEQIGLSAAEVAVIDRGGAVTKVLRSKTPAEIFLFGAVYVNADPDAYVELAFDMGRLRNSPSHLAVGQFSDPPLLSDLGGFTLEPDDIRRLRDCRAGRCAVQLPGDTMQELQVGIDWSAADVGSQVNDVARRRALGLLRRYREGGNSAFGIYRDKDHPAQVAGLFELLLGRFEALPLSLPELSRYLVDYPRATLPNVESLFYWEKIDFGLKPTLRLNHAMAYESSDPRGAIRVVAVKQLYASHYFQVALDLAACVTASGPSGRPGFYLIMLKASRQEGLTGFRGSLMRRVIVSRTRTAQENALLDIKKTLEQR